MKRYTDQVQINVQVLDEMTRVDSLEEWFVTARGLGKVDRDKITTEVLAELRPANYTLDEHHRSVNWGASSELFDLVIGIGGGAGGALLSAQLERTARKLFRRGGNVAPPMTDAWATREARNILCRRYKVDHGDFAPESVAVDVENRRATVVMTDPSGAVYTVDVKQVGEDLSLTKVTRAESRQSPSA